MKSSLAFAAASLLALGLAACNQGAQDEPVRILKSDGETVVLRGLIDATRKTPPPRFEALAARECARAGKTPVFVSMTQQTTFAFDVVFDCAAKG
ncbi:hypothetical protein [Pseudodonghicola xiamenensis]|uniref:Lipoprotein n=1 Tax=Pseudodonghicola xiamenensis TaxID=337702 RepID=A0A8J3HA78_9RHOB|nr:hypothetical protein [Pseudodonghicola xiamenensis]GHG94822.1 hypothetical protein GCM10010961_28100 [Pseudodonghicola xiamenensis]